MGAILDLPCPSVILWFFHSVTFQMKIYWVPCWRNSSYSFSTNCFETLMFSVWNEDVMWFWYNTLFFSLFLLCELSLFLDMKCYQSVKTVGTLWVQLLSQFSTNCFETLQMISAWNEDVRVVLV